MSAIPAEVLKKLAEQYLKEGLSIRQVAEPTEWSYSGVRRALLRYGVKLRVKGGSGTYRGGIRKRTGRKKANGAVQQQSDPGTGRSVTGGEADSTSEGLDGTERTGTA